MHLYIFASAIKGPSSREFEGRLRNSVFYLYSQAFFFHYSYFLSVLLELDPLVEMAQHPIVISKVFWTFRRFRDISTVCNIRNSNSNTLTPSNILINDETGIAAASQAARTLWFAR